MIKAAVQAHFMKLFDVLMASDLSDEAWERFTRGVERLATVEARVRAMTETRDADQDTC